MNSDLMMVLTIGAIALSGFVQSVTGFGFGLVSMSLLPLLLGFEGAYTIVSIMVLVTCSMTLMGNIKHYRWRQGLDLLISSCVALPVGFYVMVHVPSEWLMRGLGIFICLYSLREVVMSRIRPFNIPKKYGVVMGSISGMLSGAFHAGGPPAVIYAYSQDWTKEHIVALLQLVFLIPSIIRLILVQNHGLLRTDFLWTGLLAIVPLVLAILGGTHVLHRVKRERLRMIVFVFLFVIGLKYLIKA
ncbi:MAG: sulfite exporter TauE/SafE family protein [Phycisphaerae bacterium]|nr:sulfite exporter TauE/SafE family protein [Phycisphaerae bacterium]